MSYAQDLLVVINISITGGLQTILIGVFE